jgi:hypothetical protein
MSIWRWGDGGEALVGTRRPRRRSVATIVIVATMTVLSATLVAVVAPSLASAAGTPTTSVIIPNNGATLSGTAATLDATASSNTVAVQFLLFGGPCGYVGCNIAPGTLTSYGWVASWDTTPYANGSYALVSVAYNSTSQTGTSSHVGITVAN